MLVKIKSKYGYSSVTVSVLKVVEPNDQNNDQDRFVYLTTVRQLTVGRSLLK